MATIYRLTDRIEVKVHDIKMSLSPLTFDQKMEIQTHVNQGIASDNTAEILMATRKAMKYCIKDIKGLTDGDDNEYKLGFVGDALDDDTIEDLLNMGYSITIAAICGSMAAGIPEGDFLDVDGKPLQGVTRVKKPSKKSKGKKSPNSK